MPARELDRWTGPFRARRAAFELVSPANINALRDALMVPRWVGTEGVFTELRKQLEDDAAVFFEVPPQSVTWETPEAIDIFDLLPSGGDEDSLEPTRPDVDGEHWVEVVCISADGRSYAGAKAQLRLPDGRSEFVTLDGRSSVLFEDISEGGTVHFELSGDAQAHGSLEVPVGTRYELGGSIGLITRKRHVLIVHPNPLAFVSVELFVDDEPVVGGNYTLTTQLGDQAGTLDGELVRVDGFALPSTATYSFENVILPPRPTDQVEPVEPPIVPTGPVTPPEPPIVPTGPVIPPEPPGPAPVVDETTISFEVLLGPDETPLPGTEIRIIADGVEHTATTDDNGRVTFEGLPEGTQDVEAFVVGLEDLPTPSGEPN